MPQELRSKLQDFVDLVDSYTKEKITREELAQTIGVASSAFTNLYRVFASLIEKGENGEYMVSEPSLWEETRKLFEAEVNISIDYIFRLQTMIESLRQHEVKYRNTKIQLKDITEEGFLKSLDWDSIRQVDVIGHTGENLIRILKYYIEEHEGLRRQIRFRVLLRSFESETLSRREGVKSSIRDIMYLKDRKYNIDLLFYDSLPRDRALIIYGTSPGRKAFLGSYYFPKLGESKRSPFSFVVEENGGRQFAIERAVNWFRHYWGSDDERCDHIRTLILDFDDTIVRTYPIQIRAWCDVIKELRKDPATRVHLHEEVRFADDDTLKNWMTRVFFEEQMSEQIIDKVFISFSEHLTPEIVQAMRFKRRRAYMLGEHVHLEKEERVEFFTGFHQIFRELIKRYRVIIVSATDAEMIRSFIRDSELEGDEDFLGAFRYIFGKGEPVYAWSDLLRKSKLIFKLWALGGTPLSRMLYVGDNNKDFHSAGNIGVDFIEAALFQDVVQQSTGNPSLIQSDAARPRFTDWNDFLAVLEKVEQKKEERIRRFAGLNSI